MWRSFRRQSCLVEMVFSSFLDGLTATGMTTACAAFMADEPPAVGALWCFWIAAIDGAPTGETVIHAPTIATVGAGAKRPCLGHSTTVKAHTAERCDVPNSARICSVQARNIGCERLIGIINICGQATNWLPAAGADGLRFIAIIDTVAAAVTTAHLFSLTWIFALLESKAWRCWLRRFAATISVECRH